MKNIIILMLFSTALQSAVIDVRSIQINPKEIDCGLVDAIHSANTDTSIGGCEAGNGHDVLIVSKDLQFFTNNNHSNLLPLITSQITIRSNSEERRTISRPENGNRNRLFHITWAGELTLNNINVTGGKTAGWGGCVLNYGVLNMFNGSIDNCTTQSSGGGIMNDGIMNLQNVEILNNTAFYGGGGLYNSGVGVVNDSLFVNNIAGNGGAIENGLDLNIYSTHFTDNNTLSNGSGAIFNRTNLKLDRSSVVNNKTGGIYSITGNTKVYNSTISNNKYGVKVSSSYNSLIAEIINTTFAYNTEKEIYIKGEVDLTVVNTLLYDISDNGDNCKIETPTQQLDSNLSSDDSCENIIQSDRINLAQTITGDEMQSQHYNITNNSSAVDSGNDSICASSLINNKDQIGTMRPIGASCDIGSIEYNPSL